MQKITITSLKFDANLSEYKDKLYALECARKNLAQYESWGPNICISCLHALHGNLHDWCKDNEMEIEIARARVEKLEDWFARNLDTACPKFISLK